MEVKLIFTKIISILQEVEAVGKNKKNPQQGYMFRGIDDMYNAIHPLFSKHGVFITSEVISSTREERSTKSGGALIYTIATCRFTFWAEDGSYVASTIEGEAMDSGDKSTNKALSTALKYALMQMFLIPTEEKLDTEYDTPEVKARKEEKPMEPPAKDKKVDNRPNLNAQMLTKAIVRIKAGEIELKEKITKEFNLTPDQLKQLQAA